MSEESPSGHKLGAPRHMHESEIQLVSLLLQRTGDLAARKSRLADMHVQEMPDGKMGSLYFVSETKLPEQRRFGRRISEIQFNDVDGVAILASLNVDKDGDLYELDVWKTDYTPVIRLGPA